MKHREGLKGVVLITALLISILLVMGAFILNNISATTSGIFYGVAASLIAWLFIEIAQTLLGYKFGCEIESQISDLRSILEDKLCLEMKTREQIRMSGFYNIAYKDATEIKCSGRATLNMINDIFDKDARKKSTLAKRLRDGGLSLQILFLDPRGDLAHTGDAANDRDNILASISKIRQFCADCEKTLGSKPQKKMGLVEHFGHGSKVVVKVTTWPLNSTLFFCMNPTGNAQMLIGRLYNHVSGALAEAYELHKRESSPYWTTIYLHNLKNFEATWDSATSIVEIDQSGGYLNYTSLCQDNKQKLNINLTW